MIPESEKAYVSNDALGDVKNSLMSRVTVF